MSAHSVTVTNMIDSNSATSTYPLVPNAILDSIGIGLSIITICQTLVFILLILIRRPVTRSKEKIPFLLSLYMYVATLIFAVLLLNMFIPMLRGHLDPNTPDANDGTSPCLRQFVLCMTMNAILYANTLQALHRFFRIIHYNRLVFHQNIHLYIAGILVTSLLTALPSLVLSRMSTFVYEDYHCEIPPTNWRGILTACALIWIVPGCLTVTIYMSTIHYIRQNSSKFTVQQENRIKRDFVVIKRIVWVLVFTIQIGIPAGGTTIIYCIFGYIGWWASYLTWLTFVVSFLGMSIVHTYYAPHLRILWPKRGNRIIPTTARAPTNRTN